MKKTVTALALFLALVAGAFLLPYKSWLESRLEKILEAKGFENIDLTIASLGLKSAVLSDISFGVDMPLHLKNINLGYSPKELWEGHLDEISVNGVSLEILQQEDGWTVTGLQAFKKTSKSGSNPFALVPLTLEQLARVPFDRISLKDSNVHVVASWGEIYAPLDLTWEKTPVPHFVYRADALKFIRGDLAANSGAAEITADLEENSQWKGEWRIKDIQGTGASIDIPVLQAEGTINMDAEKGGLYGQFTDDKRLWSANFNALYTPATPEKSVLTIADAAMPWKEGRLGVSNVRLPLSGKKPVKIALKVEHVSIEELMQWLTKDRVTGTGKVSGTLPIIIGPNGKLTVLQGDLKADGPGTLVMAPESIPGDNQQVTLVREILKDLHFSALSITARDNQNGGLTFIMKIEGNNPKVYEGKPVKLNVNLTGDILEFIRQNIIFLRSPEKLLEQAPE